MNCNIEFKVCVRCFTFNHSKFIRETLNGFTIQQTTFPYICVIVDDASTDDEPKIIRNYLEENFDVKDNSTFQKEENDDYELLFAQHRENRNCYFAIYLLKYNHYRIKKKKNIYFANFIDNTDYRALCEGDDYWISPNKLQCQVDYMDLHPECTMTCTRAKRYVEKKLAFVGENYCRKSDGVVSPIDIINRTGLYIATCSVVFRPWIVENYPEYCTNCNVGDYPLQITAAMKGQVYYFNKSMCVYRVGNSSSWMGRQKHESVDPERLKVVIGQKKMFEGFSKDYPKYKSVLHDKIYEHILRNMPKRNAYNRDDLQFYQDLFPNEFRYMKLKWKLFYMIIKSRASCLKKLYYRIMLHKYQPKILIYDNISMRLMRLSFNFLTNKNSQ